jgi:hypothetical protein
MPSPSVPDITCGRESLNSLSRLLVAYVRSPRHHDISYPLGRAFEPTAFVDYSVPVKITEVFDEVENEAKGRYKDFEVIDMDGVAEEATESRHRYSYRPCLSQDGILDELEELFASWGPGICNRRELVSAVMGILVGRDELLSEREGEFIYRRRW